MRFWLPKFEYFCKPFMKKIAIVTNTSWNILNFRTSLVKHLQKEFDVLLVAPYDEYSATIQNLGDVVFLTNLSRKGTNPITDLRLVNELKKIYKTQNIDLAIHFTIKPNIYGSFAAKRAGVQSISVVTGLGYTFLNTGVAASVAKRLYKRAFRRNDLTVFQNQDDRRLFMRMGLVTEKRSRVINGSGIDTELFKPRERDDWHKGFHFLFIGRLLYDKGVRELFEAFRSQFSEKENVFLHIVGDIDESNPSAFSQTELDHVLATTPNIIYHGRVNGVQQMIANSHCVVLPSYREGLPRVMLEAIAMAKPVITTNVAGCKETVIDGMNGYLVLAQDAKELGERMMQTCKLDSETLAKMGKVGRNLAIEKFSTPVVNQEFEAEIKSILSL